MSNEPTNPESPKEPETLEEQLDLLLTKIEEREPGTVPKSILGASTKQQDESEEQIDQVENESDIDLETSSIEDFLSADIPGMELNSSSTTQATSDAVEELSAQSPEAVLDSESSAFSESDSTTSPVKITEQADEPSSAESSELEESTSPETHVSPEEDHPSESASVESHDEEADSIESQIDQLISAVHATQKEEASGISNSIIAGDTAGGGDLGSKIVGDAYEEPEIEDADIDDLLEKAQAAQQGLEHETQPASEAAFDDSSEIPASQTAQVDDEAPAAVNAIDQRGADEVDVMQIEQLDEILAKEAEQEVGDELGDLTSGATASETGDDDNEAESPDLPAEAPASAYFEDDENDEDSIEIEELRVDDEDDDADSVEESESFAAGAEDVATELDTQPEDKPIKRQKAEEDILESPADSRSGMNIFAAMAFLWILEAGLRRTCGFINTPLTTMPPDIRRTIGYIGLITLCNAMFLLMFLLLF